MSNLLSHKLVNSCIRIEQKRVSRRRSIPIKIDFDLNPEIVSQILTLKNTHQTIRLSTDNLINLRYFVLLNIAESLGAGITFNTYFNHPQTEKKAIIKTVIYLSGQAEQSIRSDAINQPEIIDSHYWLIEQIFKQINLKFKNNKSIIFWLIVGLINIIIAVLILCLIPLVFWAKILILILVIPIIGKILPNFLRQNLASWVLHQLLFGIFSNSLASKKIGFYLLSLI